MITLLFREETPKVVEIKQRLDELSLAYRAKLVAEGPDLQLQDGTKTLDQESEIIQYIDSLSGELHQWYYCNC